MQWFQIKEKAAGKKRLLLSWYLYKIFGKNILYFIANCVSFITFITTPQIRFYSKKYLNIVFEHVGIKSSLINQFKLVNAYAISLVDKFLVYCGDFNKNNLIFDNEQDKTELLKDINQKKGVFFICNHIGNIEVFQAYLNNAKNLGININVFMSRAQSKVFNDFLNSVNSDLQIRLFPIDEIGLNTGIELEEELKKGGLVFIAGDRLAENNDKKYISSELFSHKINLPKGTFKLAKLMNVPTYFISAIKVKNKYRIVLKKQNELDEKNSIPAYTEFLEKSIKINPFQFFNFYDFFLS